MSEAHDTPTAANIQMTTASADSAADTKNENTSTNLPLASVSAENAAARMRPDERLSWT